jgi:glycosyltransferase involved in cell wall biosynthesis
VEALAVAPEPQTEPPRPALRPGTRVTILTPCFWPEVRRGTERFVRDLSDGLLAAGHRPTLVTSHPGRPSRTVEDGLPIVRVPRPPDGRLRRRLFEDYVTHVPLAYAALRMSGAELAHATAPADALAAARWDGGPSVLSFMGVPDHAGLMAKRRRLEITQKAIARCDAVVVLSEAAARAFERWLGFEARVIPPGVDVDAFRPTPARRPEPTIVCAADIAEPRKNVPLLVRAFARVRRERPDAQLVLNRPRDPAAAIEGEGIELANLDTREALARAYGESWVSALPSVGEAFGLVLAEALACGTPVVGSDLGGIPEVLGGRDDVGRLFDGRDEEALARALLEALELAADPATARACRERAEELSVDRCVERYIDLYAELLR